MEPATEKRGVLSALQIRPEEVNRSALLFSYLFCASVVFTAGRTARDALFLSSYPREWLPYMFIGYGVGAAAITPLYTFLNNRFRRDLFAAAYALLLAVTYVGAWVLVRMKWNPVYPILYIWVEITSNFLIVQFWTLANELHDPREAKRLFGVIGSSRMIGIVVCGLAVGAIVGSIGTASLLLTNAGFLVLIAFLVSWIGRRYLQPPKVARVLSAQTAKPISGSWWKSQYVLWIVVMILATFTAATVGDYQFKVIAREHYDADKLAAFFALFYSLVGVCAFFFHFFVSSRLLARFGILVGLLVMPVLMGFSTLSLLITGGALAAAAMLKLSDNAFQFTINDSALQLLYYPFPGNLKARLKASLEGAIKPVAYGLGGVVLVLAAKPLGPVKLSFLVLPFIAVWVVSLVFLRGHYLKALISSLASRHLEPGGIEILPTPEVMTELKKAAHSDNDYLFEFAFAELSRLDPGEARETAEQLLKTPSRRPAALLKLAELDSSPDLIQPYLRDPDVGVRAAAIWTYAALLHEDAIDPLTPFLNSTDAFEADAAVSALMCHAELDGVLAAGSHLLKLLNGDEAERVRAARILAWARVKDFHRPIQRLLNDPSLSVRREAIRAAGRIKSRRLVAKLIGALAEPQLRPFALESLEAYGDRALEALSKALGDNSLPISVRERLPRLIRKINRPEAVNALWAHADVPDERLRIPILHHGERLQEKWSLSLDRARVRELLQVEAVTAARWLERWKNFRSLAQDPLLQEALEQTLYWSGRRVFSLLRLLYGPDAIGRIRYNLESGNSGLAASALETLDNLLAKPEREWILLLMDVSERAAAADALPKLFPAAREPAAESLVRIFVDNYNYLAAVIFRAKTQKADAVSEPEIADLVALADGLLLEELAAICLRRGFNTAALAARAREKKETRVLELLAAWPSRGPSQPTKPLEDAFMFTTLERVMFLKRVPLFARVPGEDLVRLAQEATVEEFAAGAPVFKQGDPGDAMYLIVSGSVKICVEDEEIACLKEEECFGEMAILDREPRSATVSALEPLTVLKITQDDFVEILSDRPEIAQGIIQVLTRRLRHADEEIRKLVCAQKPETLLPTT